MDSWRINCVSPVFPTSCVGSLTLIAFFSLVIPVFPTTFVFNGFNGTDLILEAGASLVPFQSALALTNHTHWVLGRALYSTPVQMKKNETLSSFSTTFVFSMVHPPSDQGGHGLTFFITPYTTLMGGLSSEYLGLLNITSNGQPYNHLFAVEFDTNQSVELDDPNGNHVGLDINNLISVWKETAGYWNGEDFHEFSLKGGHNIQAWIDYDHLQSQIDYDYESNNFLINCVSPVFRTCCVGSLTLIACFSLVIPVFPTTFVFNGFNGTNLILEEGASLVPSQSALALTNHTHWVLGRALYSTPVQMKKNETLSSFSTTFVFSMVHPPSDQGGHGLTFFITPYTTLMGGLSSEYLGLLNITSNGQPYNHLFAVEFDTNQSLEFDDPNSNHVGLDINNLISVWNETAGYWNGEDFHEFSLKGGHNIQAWIDYDHLQSQINVTITLAGLPRPQRPLISQKIDLQSVLQEKMFVGFSAATGYLIQNHYVLAWSFTTEGTARPLDISRLPSFAKLFFKHPSRRWIAGATVATMVLFSGLVAAVFFIRNKYRETIEEWEHEFWPHRFSYKELNIATNGFRDENVLGQGGFGRVYRGVLPGSGQEVAVKSITKELKEGMKGFVAEISTMGRMQHRNLVPLRGWCRMQKQLFIVYDYMPNCSLDKLIFGNPTTILPWPRRYAILKGVAAGLVYLHEGWEKRVIHRDIKSSNVLLDSELNGRLGDFGLARLYEHSENPGTTQLVGTLGYIAPELTRTAKATPSSDMFSFGVLLLEVACGRKPLDLTADAERLFLVEWVWELYAHASLLEAADPKLGNEYDAVQMELVLKLGLLCSNNEPKARLGIRQVCQILEGEAPLPDVNGCAG